MRWAILVVMLACATARADGMQPTLVRATVEGDMAHISARFLVIKEAAGSAMMSVEMPEGALVTGASVDAHHLALVEAGAAEEQYRAIEEAPASRDMRWAAKVVRAGTEGIALSIASPQAGFAELELEIAAPSCYFQDARYVAIPETWQRGLAFPLRVAKAPGCGSGQTWLAVRDRALIGKPAGFERIGGDAGRIALDDQHVARLELDIASKLGDVPRDLATVIVLDNSRSLDDARVIEQRKLVLAYVRRVPDTRIQVIAFARAPHALLPGWTTASQALPRLERLLAAEPLHNGSNLDDALAAAAGWLAQLPGTHRILVITDELLPQRIVTTNLRGALAPDTLVHVAVLDGFSTVLTRQDEGVLGPLAAATYGMRVHGEAGDPELLVRPISIDQLRVRAPGWTDMARAETTCAFDAVQLVEGAACTWWLTGDASAGQIAVEGLVWGRQLSRGFAPDLGHAEALARELSGHGGLDEAHQPIADRAAHAVNAVWSLFGSWGGHGGYGGEASGFGTSGSGTCGCDGFGTIGHGSMGSIGHPDDHLATQLGPAIAACHAERDLVSVTLELTLAETVDVAVEIQRSPDENAGILRRRHDCLVDAIWEIELTIGVPQDHQSVTVAVGK